MLRKEHAEKGQALAEFTISLIGLGVLLMGVLLIGELSRARVTEILQARAEVGSAAMSGLLSGSPGLYGSASFVQELQSQGLSATEDPIAYRRYGGAAYPYIQKNLVIPLQNPNGSLIGSFYLDISEKTQDFPNIAFLNRLGIGGDQISITERACLPVMRDFP